MLLRGAVRSAGWFFGARCRMDLRCEVLDGFFPGNFFTSLLFRDIRIRKFDDGDGFRSNGDVFSFKLG